MTHRQREKERLNHLSDHLTTNDISEEGKNNRNHMLQKKIESFSLLYIMLCHNTNICFSFRMSSRPNQGKVHECTFYFILLLLSSPNVFRCQKK